MEPISIQLSRYHLALAPVLVSNFFCPKAFRMTVGTARATQEFITPIRVGYMLDMEVS